MTSLPPISLPRGKIDSVTRLNPTETDSKPGTHYRAFLSYSHKDEALAGQIHRRLESYRLPRNLVGTQGPLGPVLAKLSPIFRDREELSAGESLSDRIRAALQVSDTLIVLCSPNAKASHWVAQEIRLFRELHPGRPVLAALIDGEPEEAFPGPLTEGGAEPVAPDFRKGRDGFRLALLKLIAGVSGVPLDALVQRDAQRQLRRVTAITGGALAAVLVMALLLVTAIRSQREAERQRAEAEGLVEYMLTDLRDRLKGVGRLDVMGAVNERAMRYYGEQGDLTSLSAESLARRARILHAMGEDDEAKGNLSAARAKFAEAHRATAAALARFPRDPDMIFAHAQSEFWMGEVAWRQYDRPVTTRHWQGYLRQAKTLQAAEPNSRRALLEIGYAYGNLCDLNQHMRFDMAAARTSCLESIRMVEAASAVEPTNVEARRTLANRYGWMANVLSDECDAASSLKYRVKERAVLDALLADDPANVVLVTRLIWNLQGSTGALSFMNNDAAASESAAESRNLANSLLARSGERSDIRSLLRQADAALRDIQSNGARNLFPLRCASGERAG